MFGAHLAIAARFEHISGSPPNLYEK